jgi:hypothetical protein
METFLGRSPYPMSIDFFLDRFALTSDFFLRYQNHFGFGYSYFDLCYLDCFFLDLAYLSSPFRGLFSGYIFAIDMPQKIKIDSVTYVLGREALGKILGDFVH